MRLLGITISEKPRIEYALTAVYGVGLSRSRKILKTAGIDTGVRVSAVTTKQEGLIRDEIEKLVLEGDLRREISGNIKRLKNIKSYRGLRHGRSLPVRGQRTKTNSRTRRGNVRKTMGSGRRKVEKK
jgi:small subunit ribosomal protein S13